MKRHRQRRDSRNYHQEINLDPVGTCLRFSIQILKCIDDEAVVDRRKEFLDMCSLALIRDWRHMKGWTSDLDMARRLVQ